MICITKDNLLYNQIAHYRLQPKKRKKKKKKVYIEDNFNALVNIACDFDFSQQCIFGCAIQNLVSHKSYLFKHVF